MQKDRHIHTLRWFMSSLLIVLFTACSSGEDGTGGKGNQPTMLTIYVYSPEAATASRQSASSSAETGNVNPIGEESTIHSLQIWIYESESKAFVGYMSTEEVATLNMGEGATYQLPVSDDFASRKPTVDVYVMANVTAENCGVGTLDKNTSHPDLLDGARITTAHFGLSSLKTSVPTQGLPMTGTLTTQPVVGEAPALRVGTESQVATVRLTRAVSKLRFVFAKTTGQPAVSITSITMNAEMIPDEEYLFKTTPADMTYNTSAAELLGGIISDIAETTDPTSYIYINQDAQTYENTINNAGLTVRGPIYLRESDRQLTGSITYKVGEDEPQTVDFQMQQAGDFRRNHTWIVYAYYAGSGGLQVRSLYVKEWANKDLFHEFYNW